MVALKLRPLWTRRAKRSNINSGAGYIESLRIAQSSFFFIAIFIRTILARSQHMQHHDTKRHRILFIDDGKGPLNRASAILPSLSLLFNVFIIALAVFISSVFLRWRIRSEISMSTYRARLSKAVEMQHMPYRCQCKSGVNKVGNSTSCLPYFCIWLLSSLVRSKWNNAMKNMNIFKRKKYLKIHENSMYPNIKQYMNLRGSENLFKIFEVIYIHIYIFN